MTRIVNRTVDVTVGPGGVPVSFRLSGARYQVREVLDYWCETGRWWEREDERLTYRVATSEGGIYELTRLREQKRWQVYKSYD